jgi:hypothetical protein
MVVLDLDACITSMTIRSYMPPFVPAQQQPSLETAVLIVKLKRAFRSLFRLGQRRDELVQAEEAVESIRCAAVVFVANVSTRTRCKYSSLHRTS